MRQWLAQENPLGLFNDQAGITLADIDPSPYSGHFDFLVESSGRQLVVRMKGSEWGTREGLVDEYHTLCRIAQHKVAPAVYYLTTQFFGEPMILEEYIVGTLFPQFAHTAQSIAAPAVGRFIATINQIPFAIKDFPFRQLFTSYMKSAHRLYQRIAFIADCKETKSCGRELLSFLPGIKSILNEYDILLQRVLEKTGPSFVFPSAHAGHLVVCKDEFRFFNWEKVSYGDPSYTLAVFLLSLEKQHPDFEGFKARMIDAYLALNPIPEFKELLEARMVERRVANAVYQIYMSAKKGITYPSWQRIFAWMQQWTGK